METKELVERLRHYNDWRRGENEEQPSPTDIGLWIEEICKKVEDQSDRIVELWEAVKKLNKEKDALFVARQERDEAIAELKIALEQWQLCIELAKRNEQERDEARGEIKDAIKWFEWCLETMNPPFDFEKFVSASESCKKLKRESAK